MLVFHPKTSLPDPLSLSLSRHINQQSLSVETNLRKQTTTDSPPTTQKKTPQTTTVYPRWPRVNNDLVARWLKRQELIIGEFRRWFRPVSSVYCKHTHTNTHCMWFGWSLGNLWPEVFLYTFSYVFGQCAADCEPVSPPPPLSHRKGLQIRVIRAACVCWIGLITANVDQRTPHDTLGKPKWSFARGGWALGELVFSKEKNGVWFEHKKNMDKLLLFLCVFNHMWSVDWVCLCFDFLFKLAHSVKIYMNPPPLSSLLCMTSGQGNAPFARCLTSKADQARNTGSVANNEDDNWRLDEWRANRWYYGRAGRDETWSDDFCLTRLPQCMFHHAKRAECCEFGFCVAAWLSSVPYLLWSLCSPSRAERTRYRWAKVRHITFAGQGFGGSTTQKSRQTKLTRIAAVATNRYVIRLTRVCVIFTYIVGFWECSLGNLAHLYIPRLSIVVHVISGTHTYLTHDDAPEIALE